MAVRGLDRLFAATDRQVGLARFEDAAFLNRLRLANQATSLTTSVLDALLGVGRGAVTLVGFLGTLIVLSPWVLVRRVPAGAVRTGQVVVIRAPRPPVPVTLPDEPDETLRYVLPDDRLLLKRLVAGPGDPVPRADVPPLRDVPEPVVPAERFVVLGDNATISYDSRAYGYVSADLLVGVVLRTLT